MLILSVILLILFIVGESENDIVMTDPKRSLFPSLDWYNRYNYKGKNWWMKNVISFLGDGFHFWKAITIFVTSYFFCINIGINGWWSVAIFAIAGTYHSIRNGSFFRKGLK